MPNNIGASNVIGKVCLHNVCDTKNIFTTKYYESSIWTQLKRDSLRYILFRLWTNKEKDSKIRNDYYVTKLLVHNCCSDKQRKKNIRKTTVFLLDQYFLISYLLFFNHSSLFFLKKRKQTWFFVNVPAKTKNRHSSEKSIYRKYLYHVNNYSAIVSNLMIRILAFQVCGRGSNLIMIDVSRRWIRDNIGLERRSYRV